MGHFFKETELVDELPTEQQRRYRALRFGDRAPPPVLHERLKELVRYCGTSTTTIRIAILEELFEDAYVQWVLAGEDADRVKWTAPAKMTSTHTA